MAFDKGYVDYGWFGSLTNQGASFATRLRAKAVVYRVVEELIERLRRGLPEINSLSLQALTLKNVARRLYVESAIEILLQAVSTNL